MKRTKLIASLSLLALTICSLAFGVYAGITANFTATGSITFSALDEKVDFVVEISGLDPSSNGADANGTKTLYATTKNVTSGTNNGWGGPSGATYTFVDDSHGLTLSTAQAPLLFDELNDETENKITIKIKVYNYSDFDVKTTSEMTKMTGLKINNTTNNVTKTALLAKTSGTDTTSIEYVITPVDNNQGVPGASISIAVNVVPSELYSITPNLTNCSLSNSSTMVEKGQNYTATLIPAANCELPQTITIKVGSTTLTAGADYTYNSSTGEISILSTKVTGAISITAEAENGELAVLKWDNTNKYYYVEMGTFNSTNIRWRLISYDGTNKMSSSLTGNKTTDGITQLKGIFVLETYNSGFRTVCYDYGRDSDYATSEIRNYLTGRAGSAYWGSELSEINTSVTNFVTDFNINTQDNIYKSIQKVSFQTGSYAKTIATSGGDSLWLLSLEEMQSLLCGGTWDNSKAMWSTEGYWTRYFGGDNVGRISYDGSYKFDSAAGYYHVRPAFQIGL